jgi:hypothetical protein
VPSCGHVNNYTFTFDIRVRHRAIPLRQLMVAQLLQKFLVRNAKSSTVFRAVRHWSLSWTEDSVLPSHPASRRYFFNIILPSTRRYFSSGCTSKYFYSFLMRLIRTTCLPCLALLNLSIQYSIARWKVRNFAWHRYGIFSSLLQLSPSHVKMFFSYCLGPMESYGTMRNDVPVRKDTLHYFNVWKNGGIAPRISNPRH